MLTFARLRSKILEKQRHKPAVAPYVETKEFSIKKLAADLYANIGSHGQTT